MTKSVVTESYLSNECVHIIHLSLCVPIIKLAWDILFKIRNAWFLELHPSANVKKSYIHLTGACFAQSYTLGLCTPSETSWQNILATFPHFITIVLVTNVGNICLFTGDESDGKV